MIIVEAISGKGFQLDLLALIYFITGSLKEVTHRVLVLFLHRYTQQSAAVER